MKIYGTGLNKEKIWREHDSPSEYLKGKVDLSTARNVEEYLCKVHWGEYFRTRYEILEEHNYEEVSNIEDFFSLYPSEAVELDGKYLWIHYCS